MINDFMMSTMVASWILIFYVLSTIALVLIIVALWKYINKK